MRRVDFVLSCVTGQDSHAVQDMSRHGTYLDPLFYFWLALAEKGPERQSWQPQKYSVCDSSRQLKRSFTVYHIQRFTLN